MKIKVGVIQYVEVEVDKKYDWLREDQGGELTYDICNKFFDLSSDLSDDVCQMMGCKWDVDADKVTDGSRYITEILDENDTVIVGDGE